MDPEGVRVRPGADTEQGAPVAASRDDLFLANGRRKGKAAPEQLLRVRAPLRVSFAGGGTDVPPFPEREGGLVLNATISRYAYGTLRPRSDRDITIESLDFGLELRFGAEDPITFNGELDLIKAAILRLGERESQGFDLFLHSTAPPGSGLGASSAMMVALIGLLTEFHGLPLTDYEIAHSAYLLEREELGLKGGMQDQYAATFGGFNFIEFHGDRVIVNPLRVRPDIVKELEQNLLLGYTGVARSSDRIIEDQTSRFEDGDSRAMEGLRMQKELAIEMKDALLQGQLRTFAELLGSAWKYKKRMSPKISTAFIDEIYSEALKHGALGGKVTGAGGGGYMLFYCDYHRKHKVAEALTRMGVNVADFAFETEGLSTWRAGA
jgi:D-glycero-alpha-D-manno-heptose-7-phosphate kinase